LLYSPAYTDRLAGTCAISSFLNSAMAMGKDASAAH
jgi:hypothetical protein